MQSAITGDARRYDGWHPIIGGYVKVGAESKAPFCQEDNGVDSGARGSGSGLASLTDLVYEELLDAIIEQRLPPGTRVVPGTLAAELGVSPTPVRLALTRLAADGLVTVRSRRGMQVSRPDVAQIEGLYEARLFLEVGAARDYFRNVTPEFIANLQSAAQEYEEIIAQGGDGLRRRLGDKDRELHRLIVHLTRNELIIRWYERANIHIQGHRSAYPSERYGATVREHRAIVDAFREGGPEDAIAALREHLANAKAYLLHMLGTASQPPRLRNIRKGGDSLLTSSGGVSPAPESILNAVGEHEDDQYAQ